VKSAACLKARKDFADEAAVQKDKQGGQELSSGVIRAKWMKMAKCVFVWIFKIANTPELGENMLKRYLENPCKTLATAFWKEQYFSKPPRLKVVHESEYKGTPKGAERYFRLIHWPCDDYYVGLPKGYSFKKVDLPQEAKDVADFINLCYEGYSISPKTVLSWADFPVFDRDLWIWLHGQNGPAALGIADFDVKIGEGSLEWIQVLPIYRGNGFGSVIVTQLLQILAIRKRAKFITVSGKDNAAEILYRKCGFAGDD
jgi:GNAT superfamily N-acetyltransferase